jgi:regulator of PEP synthase PpsR (kinase-PPPase family)
MGSTLNTIFESDVEVYSASNSALLPRIAWEVPDDTRRAIEEIDANIRAAEQMSGRLVAG